MGAEGKAGLQCVLRILRSATTYVRMPGAGELPTSGSARHRDGLGGAIDDKAWGTEGRLEAIRPKYPPWLENPTPSHGWMLDLMLF